MSSGPQLPDGQRHIYAAVLRLLRPYRTALLVSLLLGLVATAASLGQPYMIGKIVARIQSGTSAAPVIGLLVGLFALAGVASAVQAYLIVRSGAMLAFETRRTLIGRLLRASMAAHRENRRGDLGATAAADTTLLGVSLTQNLALIVMSVITVLGTVAVMGVVDPLLTGVTFACVGVTLGLTFLVTRRIRMAAIESRSMVGEFSSAMQRALAAIATIKISRAEGRETDRVAAGAGSAYRADLRVARLAALLQPAMNLGIQLSFAAVFTVGASRVADHAMNLGMFAAFVLYLLYLISPLFSFITAFGQFQQGLAAVVRVGQVGSLPVEEDLPSSPVPAAAGQAAPASAGQAAPGQDAAAPVSGPVLAFDQVNFGYRAGAPVLRNVSFQVPRRGVTAVVGTSGAGKSTVFSLIERFWEVSDGQITLDGADIRQLPRHQLRSRVGLVEQDAPVLDGTVRENLRYANPDASDEQIAEVVDTLRLRDWTESLRDGLDSQVGEQGAEISGGQRQRIAVARMLLMDPDLLLLDEPSSQLDSEAEASMRDAIEKIGQQRAVMMIGHRLSMISAADQIIVLDGGGVVAQGCHAELLASCPVYRQLATPENEHRQDRHQRNGHQENGTDHAAHRGSSREAGRSGEMVPR